MTPPQVIRFAPLCLSLLALSASAARAVEAKITRLDGSTLTADIVAIGSAVSAETPSGRIELAWPELLSIDFEQPDPADAPPPAPWRFHLSDGSRITATIAGAGPQRLMLQSPAIGDCEIALRMLHAVAPADPPPALAAAWETIIDEPAPTDEILLVRKDDQPLALRGVVRAADEAGLTFEWNDRRLKLPWERVGGLRTLEPVQAAATLQVHLLGGDQISGDPLGGTAQTLRLRSPALGQVTVDLARITRITCRSDRVIYLSQLPVQRYDMQPLLAKRWNFALDQNLAGQPITLADQTYARGVTLHSRAEISFALGGQFENFAATVGIDDRMDSRGDAIARLIGDGEILWEGRVQGSADPLDVQVSVRGVRMLTLHADYGEDLDLSDQVCWAAARLIKAE